jgi:hypothetical protein
MDELCLVCFNEFPNQDIYKYHCSTCKKIICDVCYDEHIKISTKCVFCRGDLTLPQKEIQSMIQDNSHNILDKRSTYCWITCFTSFLIFITMTIFTTPTYKNDSLLNNTILP